MRGLLEGADVMASDFDLQAGSVGMTLDEVRERYGRHYWIESEWTTEAGVTTRNSTVVFRAVCAEDALKQFRERAPESNMRVVSVKPAEAIAWASTRTNDVGDGYQTEHL